MAWIWKLIMEAAFCHLFCDVLIRLLIHSHRWIIDQRFTLLGQADGYDTVCFRRFTGRLWRFGFLEDAELRWPQNNCVTLTGVEEVGELWKIPRSSDLHANNDQKCPLRVFMTHTERRSKTSPPTSEDQAIHLSTNRHSYKEPHQRPLFKLS